MREFDSRGVLVGQRRNAADRPAEYRSAVRAETVADGGAYTEMTIVFARFDEWNEIDSPWEGRFLEMPVRGCYADWFNEHGPDGDGSIRALFDHGLDPSIGDKILGIPTDVREGDIGPVGTVDVLRAQYAQDIAEGVDKGGYGASYRFRAFEEHWNETPGRSDHNPEGIPERRLLRCGVPEFGPVPFPADAGTNNLQTARSLDGRYNKFAARTVETLAPDADEPTVGGASQQPTTLSRHRLHATHIIHRTRTRIERARKDMQ